MGDEIKLEKINDDNINSSNNLNDNEDSLKMGEIIYKDNKYYFIPNKKEEMKELTGEELFTWLIFKGNKFPLTKNKYKIKEGDILKLGRVWLIIRAIHIQKKKLERKNTNCLISFHSQANQSLNVNNDFKEDIDYNNILDENESSDISENDEDMKVCVFKNGSNNKENKMKAKYNKSKIITIKKNIEKIKNEKNLDSNKIEKQKICRICYLNETDSITNPLIKPCKCAGSMKYIHLKCLLHWLKTKIQIEKSEYIDNNYFTLYSSEQVECELCKQIFPHYIKHNNKLYNLMELEQNYDNDQKNKKKKNNINYSDGDNNKKNKEKKDLENEDSDLDDDYVVLDTISFEKETKPYRYIAKFNKNKILKIGRGLDMNLILNDLSISRNHCQLELSENNDVLLKDNNSKFGTLILVQAKAIEILKGQTLTIQVGRTFFNINYKKNFKLFSCCETEEIDKKKTYENINYKSIKIDNHCIILTESDTERSDKEEEKEIEKNNNENDYENIIKNINNKKINIIKISRTKKNLEEEQETNIKSIKDNNQFNNNNSEIRNNNSSQLKNEDKEEENNKNNKKEDENKKDNNNLE